MTAKWWVALVLSSIGAGSCFAQASDHARYEQALEACNDAFDALVGSDDIWVSEDLCTLDLATGPVTFAITKAGRSLFMQSTLEAYGELYAPDGYVMEPFGDERTFRLGALVEGEGRAVFLHPDLGGVYSFAHFTGDRVAWIRCNTTRSGCVYYDDLLMPVTVTDRWDRQVECHLRWTVFLPPPADGSALSAFMDVIGPFIADFGSRKGDDLLLGCLRPSQRVEAG
ncbi:hypothetical protein SAMN06295905_1536 [Devosia lucknowensis]|uniref:Uncharacterized protein n=1 Tax=Devosia lucknowensis TaxID=1096929 RepID=A0A1Y6EXC6_9HYPH|nr:hypothetical protein [Devosia lucknowensis]SMQ66926.1 hypothetical protein SAMN06295905_1536 [Devosia lucknowensis]